MICSLLYELNIQYCIDSGTLLGLIREGKLLAHDLDIDISINVSQQKKLIELIYQLKKNGYKCRVLSFYGKKYKYKFWNSSEKRVIDINIFRKTADNSFYICPQPFPLIKDENIFFKYFRKLIRICFGVMKNIGDEFDLNSFPWRIGTYHRTWIIPKEYFNNYELLSNNIYIPSNVTKYLQFRYGSWKVPNNNWNFRTDDKGLSTKSPNIFDL
jgi:phosphorylcholine metabolism protein LicD